MVRDTATDFSGQHPTPANLGRLSERPPNIIVPPPPGLSLGEDLHSHRNHKDDRERPSSPQEVELGVYLQASFSDAGTPRSPLGSASPSRGRFSSRHTSVPSFRTESFFLANPQWRTDIVTFCSHARIDSVLGRARITHVQARKSRRPPFLHEYLLVFFTATQGQRFVVRIDRLGKVGSPSSGSSLGWCAGQRGVAANTAKQEVGVFHLQDTQTQVDALDGPWLSNDGRWGSCPVATLVTWENARDTSGQVSHHVKTASTQHGPSPRLSDVSRLLEAILLEMPTYHLMTTNCYFMTRSSLLLLQRCFPTSFACYLGAASGELVPPSELAEPVWAGLLRWYLPFVLAVLMIYLPTVIFTQIVLAGTNMGEGSPIIDALRISAHAIIDIPLPVGFLHTWMTSLEVRINDLVLRIATGYRELLARENPDCGLLGDRQPFGVPFAKPWYAFAAWCIIGATCTLVLILKPVGVLIMFFAMLAFAITFNLKFFNSDILEDPFAVDPLARDALPDGDLPALESGDPIFGT